MWIAGLFVGRLDFTTIDVLPSGRLAIKLHYFSRFRPRALPRQTPDNATRLALTAPAHQVGSATPPGTASGRSASRRSASISARSASHSATLRARKRRVIAAFSTTPRAVRI
jgi:hypothetical protein